MHPSPKATFKHWREIYCEQRKRLKQCRPVGSPAGTWPSNIPYWHHIFHDPYERINFWSHVLPGAFFLLFPLFASNVPPVVLLFCMCTATTHLCSALTHVYPDNHQLEKLDHIGITATIIGTPVSALMAKEHGHLPRPLQVCSALLVAAAFLPPKPRVAGFVLGSTAMVVLYGHMLLDFVFIAELVLYLAGALLFLRNDGHARGVGFSDHHFLHYFVTIAGVLHVYYLYSCI